MAGIGGSSGGGGGGAGWDEGDLDSVSFDEDFVRGATIREADVHVLPKGLRRRRRLRRRSRGPRRRPQLSTVVLLLVMGTLVALLGAGVAGVGPAAWMAGSLGIGDDAEEEYERVAESTTSTIELATTTTQYGLEGGAYRPGDCIIWNEKLSVASDVPVKTVDCSEPHFFESTGNFELPGAMNYPESEATWDVISVERCTPIATKYLGGPLVSTGRFYTTTIHPSKEGWRVGDRAVHCGILATGDTWAPVEGEDHYVAFTGAVKELSQEQVPPAGTCYGDAGEHMEIVACTSPHLVEVTGHVGLAGRIDHPPTDDEFDRLLGGDCRGVAARYLGRPLRRDEQAHSLEISAEEWGAGWRTMPCTVGRTNRDGWVAVSGSLAAQ